MKALGATLLVALALGPAAAAWAGPGPEAPSLSEWLVRIHEASKRRAYVGTFVVSTAGAMASARIWHVCDGTQQLERVENLTGAPRTTVRRNEEVVTFDHHARTAVRETRSALGLFPALLQAHSRSVEAFYALKPLGQQERVAGLLSDVFELQPKDDWRFGYRVWVERQTGLMLKLQTLDASRTPLEQVAFSDLQLNAGLKTQTLLRDMGPRSGYTVVQLSARATTAAEQGWRLKAELPGFQTVAVQLREAGQAAADGAWQWVFSDGLASLSVFIEKFQPQLHVQEGQWSSGATHTLTRRVGAHWVTAVGEVPPQTLQRVLAALQPPS